MELTDLPEYCLLEIFQYLDLKSLLSVDLAFPEQLRVVVTNLFPSNMDQFMEYEWEPLFSYSNFEEIFAEAGHLITILRVRIKNLDLVRSPELQLALSHCKNVKRINLYGGTPFETNLEDLPLLFESITELSLEKVCITDKQLIWLLQRNINSLKYLRIKECNLLKGPFQRHLNNMETCLFYGGIHLPEKGFTILLKNNPNLKRLALHGNRHLLSLVGQSLKNLESLELVGIYDLNQEGLELARLPNLKTLHIDFNRSSIVCFNHNLFLQALAETNSVEHLTLFQFMSLTAIGGMTNLKTLHITPFTCKISTIFNLKKLEKLSIDYCPISNKCILEAIRELPLLSRIELGDHVYDITPDLEKEILDLSQLLNRKIHLKADYPDPNKPFVDPLGF